MSSNPYRITDKSHADIMAAMSAVDAAQKNLAGVINIIGRAIGVPDGYRYDIKEQAFNPPKEKPADVQG